MVHPYPIREIARQAGVSEATVDRVLNGRGGVRASTVNDVRQAVTDLDRQRSQLRLNGRVFMIDIVMQTPDRFSSAVQAALEQEIAALAPAVLRSRFHFREKGPAAELAAILDLIGRRGSVLHHDLPQDMRRACRIIMAAHGALDGPAASVPAPIQVITPFNLPDGQPALG